MKNNGFTLIEIIVVLVLISLMGITISGVILNNKKNNTKELNRLKNVVLEAASVYINTKTDEEGNNYIEEINKGSRGLQIPIKTLINDGLVEEKTIKRLYELEKEKDSTKKYDDNNYVLVALGGTTPPIECGSGELTITLSYELKSDTPVYLCKKDVNTSISKEDLGTIIKNINIMQALDITKLKVSLEKNAVSESYYASLPKDSKKNYIENENGIFYYYDEYNDKIYAYYRGNVDNNYLELGKDKDNNKLLWRILWLSEDNKMKLIYDSEIPIEIDLISGKYTLKKSDILYGVVYNEKYYYGLNPDVTTSDTKTENRYSTIYYNYDSMIFNHDNMVDTMIKMDQRMFDSNNFYYKKAKEWYNSTSLSSISYITKSNNFCYNNYYSISEVGDYTTSVTRKEYKPSNKFQCQSGEYSKSEISPTYYEQNFSSSFGFMTYGEALRAGLSGKGTDLKNSGSFLLKENNNSYPLIDNQYYYDYSYRERKQYESSTRYAYYYVDNAGLKHGDFFQEYQDLSSYYIEGSSKDRDYYFYQTLKIKNGDAETVIADQKPKNDFHFYKTYFLANTIKPTILIDVNHLDLEGDGTDANPFVLKKVS